MQGQRSTVEWFPETFEFDQASSSSNWTDVLSPGDAQNLPDCLLSPNGVNMSYRNVLSHECESSSNWNVGSASSDEPIMSQASHIEAKMENGWTASLTASARSGPSLERRRLEEGNFLSLDNVSINLNRKQIASDQLLLQSSTSNNATPCLDCNVGSTGNDGQISHSGIGPLYSPFVSEVEQIPSASCFKDSCGTSSGGAYNLSQDDDVIHGSTLDSRRSSGKRKMIEGVSGQSSGSGSHGCFQQTENGLPHTMSAKRIASSGLNISSSTGNPPSADPPEEQLNIRYNAGARGGPSECLSSASVERAGESSQRNFRVRLNPANPVDSSAPNIWASGNSGGRPNVCLPQQPSGLLIPFNQSLEASLGIPITSSRSHSRPQSVSGLRRLVQPITRNGTSGSQIGSSSNSLPSSSQRSAMPREEATSWGTQRNDVFEHSMFFPAIDVGHVGHVAQDPTEWGLANSNISLPGIVASTSRVGSSSGVHPSTSLNRLPHQGRPDQYEQTLSELVHRSFPTVNSDPGGQLNDFLPQRSGHSSSPQEIVRQPGVGLRTHHQQILRSAFSMDRRSDVLGAPLTSRTLAAAREGRSRMISEHIRNALDLMRRGGNIRFESAVYGVVDLHDRHRDMRLDVDNMSYEELLALEERIGNVSTGLSEEAILKHLKQRKCLSVTMTPSTEVEPCCICQEDYLSGQDIGTLNCGHDFHSACIKQWLTHKNLCPICKMTALDT